ncbi:MAG: hypothetical protein KC583_21685, partial [Myxococcales bacterium]|nr:hypothetical protein [Myxococcales bacterium]
MIRLTRCALGAAIAATLTFVGAASAAPPRMPVQGVLTTVEGAPIAGELPVRFALYAAPEGGVAVWEEEQTVAFDAGFFTASLGAVEPLDPALIAENEVLWLGIAVDDDAEMARLELGTAPFAAFAVFAGDADRLGGQDPESFAASAHRHGWDELDGVPDGLADGDDDTTYQASPGGGLELVDGGFALLSGCAEGEILRREADAWACAVIAGGGAIAAFELDGTVLGITDGEATLSVDLAALATDLDPTNELLSGFALAGSTLQIADAGGTYEVDLAALVDDADADPLNETNTDLTFDGFTLAITDAAGTLEVDLAALNGDADPDPGNETNTDLTFDGVTLAITDAEGTLEVDLSALGDDADADPRNETNTDLAFDGTMLSVTDAAGALSVDLSALGDDADADPRNETNTDL